MPARVKLAGWLAFALHGIFILTTRYRLSYDAYNHMFFGDHYRLDWWSLWETRWYTGFEVNSYPPLVHQLIGLLGHVIGVDAAFGLLLWGTLSAYPIAIYAFCRIFTGKAAAGYAALGAAVLPSIFQTAHTFGQLPTLTGTLFALFAMAALNDFLLSGSRLGAACAVALIGAVMAAHHATLLFLPWAAGAVFIHNGLNRKVGWLLLMRRFCSFACLAVLIGLLVIWPFWVWGRGQTLQTPIDHPSRHNFLVDPFAPLAFFLPVYGALIPLIPWVFCTGFRRKTFGLWFGFVFLFLLGLGDTTPLPRWMFGSGWVWLTYDRFAFWASLFLLPFLGIALVLVRKKFRPVFFRKFPVQLQPSFLPKIWFSWPGSARMLPGFLSARISKTGYRFWLVFCVFSFTALTAFVSGLLPTLLPTQPAQVDMQPIVDFLAAGDRARWRYLTFGLGDQLAYLSRLTTATTIDGSYHTARTLPELRESGIGQIDTAYWLPDGLSRLDPILQKSGERGVRWGFVNRADYIPILERSGWLERAVLRNGVQVWENPQAILPPPVQPPPESPLAVFSWGCFPILTFLLALLLCALRLWPSAARKFLVDLHFIAIGLLPLALSFWYFQTLFAIDIPGVYFTYDHILIFVSDGVALAAVLCWLLPVLFGPSSERVIANPLLTSRSINLQEQEPGFHLPVFLEASSGWWLLGLCLLAFISCFWSLNWLISLYFSLHMCLAFGLFLSIQARPAAWRAFALGSMAALFVQAVLGFWQFAAQNTAFLAPLGLNWPGSLQPADRAAGVVQLMDGTRWLRVYGTLPHPNILGGLVFVFVAGLIAFYLLGARPGPVLLILVGFGLILLELTFSRSAWLALAVFVLIVIVCQRRFERQRLGRLLLLGFLSLALVSIPLRQLIFTRSGGGSAISTEAFSSNARLWLLQQSLQFIRERPLTGLGAGTAILEIASRAPYGYIIEPVHNVLVLAASEIGLPGALLLLGLAASLFLKTIRARRPENILFLAVVLGLGVIGVFDHYLWTLAPGRLLSAMVLGLQAGQSQS